jgi:hypothetical protein
MPPTAASLGPPEGTGWKPPHGYSQTVRWDGTAVSKRFSPDAISRRTVEATLLSAVASHLPVPKLLPGAEDEVRTEWIAGIMGQTYVGWRGPSTPIRTLRRRNVVRFMAECGAFVRALHSLGHLGLDGTLPGSGRVICHGDFAPYNVMVQPRTGRILGVIDWEIGHLGDPVEDLAWMEWGMREWYFPAPVVIAELYRAYGRWFSWKERHEAMVERRRPLHALVLRPEYPEQHRARAIEHWERLLALEEVISQDMVEADG